MNKKAKRVKNDVLTSIKNAVTPLFEECKDAPDFTYTNSAGVSDTEKPGTYNKRITGLMLYDITQASLLLTGQDEDAAELLEELGENLEERDILIRRMFDDRKDKRPVIKYPYGDTGELIKRLTDMSKTGIYENTAFGNLPKAIKACVTRLLKCDIWAFMIEAEERINEAVSKAEMRAYDDEGHIVYGISEKDEETVKIIVSMEKSLLKALSRIPAYSDNVQPTLKRIELIETLIHAIVTEDEEMIERLEKAAKVAENFYKE